MRARPRRFLPATLIALAALPAMQWAAAQKRPAGALKLPSCAGSDLIEINLRGGDAALLDEGDRRGAAAAMGRRYAVLGPAFEPVAIVLWRRPGFGWIYVALESPREPPPAWCFSATFSAPVFDFTPALQRKYFFAGASRS